MQTIFLCVFLLVHVSSSNCCFTFAEKKISSQRIQCYKNTSSACSRSSLMWVALPGSVPDSLLQGPEISPPGIRMADARWRCSTRFWFPNLDRGRQDLGVQSPVWAPGGALRFLAGARRDAPALPQWLGFLATPRRQVLYPDILYPEEGTA